MSKHLMFDIETLATTPKAIVLSVGAVLFNEDAITAEFYTNVSITPQIGVREFNEDTFYWWMAQSAEAGAALSANRKSPNSAMRELMDWLHTCGVDMGKVKVWGNGAVFDNVIMRDLLNSYGYDDKCLWKFWNDRCFRTYVAENNIEKVQPDVAHHALDDARAQAMTLIRYWSK